MSNPRYPEEFKIEAVCSGRTRSAGGGGSCSFGHVDPQPICLGKALQQAPRAANARGRSAC
jgi:hypothetical protein